MDMTVGELARLAGITVRTLHHYDELGLVSASERSGGGYRLYDAAAVDRLQEVLFFRELGFGLDDIRSIVNDPGYDRIAALARQRLLMEQKATRLQEIMGALDRAVEAERQGIVMDAEEKLEIFGNFDPAEHAFEAHERWGATDAYQESARRTASYTEDDWLRIRDENQQIYRLLLKQRAAGLAPEDPGAMDAAEAHRALISKWFYDCPVEMHAQLGRMYLADNRFKDNIDEAGEGLAEYLSAAIAANAARGRENIPRPNGRSEGR